MGEEESIPQLSPEGSLVFDRRTVRILFCKVNYGEAKDLPASCFMDRTRTEPKVNLLVWPSYTYLHRS